MSPKEICTKLSLWIVNFYLKSYIFCFHFTLYLHVWIRIRIPNTDPDPESSWIRIQYGSGSTTLVKTVREFVFPLSVPTVRRPQPCLHSSSWLASISTHWGKSVFSMFKQKIFLNKFHFVCPSECCKQDLVFYFVRVVGTGTIPYIISYGHTVPTYFSISVFLRLKFVLILLPTFVVSC